MRGLIRGPSLGNRHHTLWAIAAALIFVVAEVIPAAAAESSGPRIHLVASSPRSEHYLRACTHPTRAVTRKARKGPRSFCPDCAVGTRACPDCRCDFGQLTERILSIDAKLSAIAEFEADLGAKIILMPRLPPFSVSLPSINATLVYIQNNIPWLLNAGGLWSAALRGQANRARATRLYFVGWAPPRSDDTTKKPAALPRELSTDSTDALIDGMRDCFAQGAEVRLTATAARCVAYREKKEELKPPEPDTTDIDRVCKDPTDKRILPVDIINRLIPYAPNTVANSGIRILGAIFCDELKLVGSKLNHSLILDYAIFRNGMALRNVTIEGDLSLEHSIIMGDELLVQRSRISGTLYARRSFVERLLFEDLTVGASIHLKEAVVAQYLIIDRSMVSADIFLNEAAASYLLIRHSRAGARLDLSKLGLRCAAHVNQNDLGDFLAFDMGFGSMDVGNARYNWGPARANAAFKRFAGQTALSGLLADKTACPIEKQPAPEFFLFDNKITRSMCIRQFGWPTADIPTTAPGGPVAVFAVKSTTIGSNLILDLFADDSRRSRSLPLVAQKVELVGIDTKFFIMHFQRSSEHVHSTFVSGLKFDSALTGDITCFINTVNRPDETAYATASELRRHTMTTELQLPSMQLVVDWLAKNKAKSTQPFTAFVDAYTRAGTDAKELKIIKAWAEFRSGRDRWVQNLWDWRADPLTSLLEGITVGWRYLWGLTFDFGYRPEKVIQCVLLILLSFVLLFWVALGACGFRVKSTEQQTGFELLPFGAIFFFDHLIPVYKINEKNYDFDYVLVFARRASKEKIKQTIRVFGRLPKIEFLGFKPRVAIASDRQRRRAIFWIQAVKFIGAVLTIFFSAAIGALAVK
jgi:hypothetical protein